MISEYYAHKYCCEPIENIEGYQEAVADTKQMWCCHHIGEVLPCGNFSIADLKKFNLYWNRPASELTFVTPSQHAKIHRARSVKGGKKGGKISMAKRTSEQQAKYGKLGGKKGGPKGAKIMNAKLTFEQRSKAGKAGGAKTLGHHWWNNGIEQHHCKECPGPGWVKGMLKRS